MLWLRPTVVKMAFAKPIYYAGINPQLGCPLWPLIQYKHVICYTILQVLQTMQDTAGAVVQYKLWPCPSVSGTSWNSIKTAGQIELAFGIKVPST